MSIVFSGARDGEQSSGLPEFSEENLCTAAESDRRGEPRFLYQTVATTIDADAGDAQAEIKCWTRDLSPSGARIMSLEPIFGNTIRLKLMLPKLGQRLIEAEIVSRSTELQSDFHNRNSRTLYLYGMRFTKVLGGPSVR
jgi:hypothetical protein